MHKRFVDEQELLLDSFRLAVTVYNSGFRPTCIAGLWRGGATVGIYVQECLHHLGVHTRHGALRTSYEGVDSYQRMIAEPAAIRVDGPGYFAEIVNRDDRLLIVDDICASGSSIAAVRAQLSATCKGEMPLDTRIACVWYRPAQSRIPRQPDYFLRQTDDWLVMPYEMTGLTRHEIDAHKRFLVPIVEDVLSQTAATRWPG